jgi:aspartate/methionine/tyrosine aminotransferase
MMNGKLEDSASMEVAALANKLKVDGVDVVSLAIGDTHFRLSSEIQERIKDAMLLNLTHYSLAQGEVELREGISKSYGNAYSSDEIVITHGVKNGLYSYLLATERSRVCAIEPAWLGYKGLCTLARKEYIGLNRKSENWIERLSKLDFDILLLCSPNNPDGYVYSNEELEKIYTIASSKGAEIVLDEIYKSFVYGKTISGVSSFHGNDRVVLLDGFSKSHAATGLRVGYLATKDRLLCREIVKIQQNAITCVNTISQHGLRDFGELDQVVEGYIQYYSKNRSLVAEYLPEMRNFEPQGGFYYFFDLRKFGIELSAKEFCKGLLASVAVALIPGDAYGTGFDTYVRLSFCVDTADLTKGLIRLKKHIEKCKIQ